jgi:ribulose-phosphate 3-epimerase
VTAPDPRLARLKGIAPSILASDFGALRSQVQECVDAGVTVIHVVVLDGHFVPPITMGPIVVEAL